MEDERDPVEVDLYDLLPHKHCGWAEAHTAHVWTDGLDGGSWVCETVVTN